MWANMGEWARTDISEERPQQMQMQHPRSSGKLHLMMTVPDSLLQTIVEIYAPRRVLLFGSQARGDARPDSDIDLVVVLDDDAPPETLSWRNRNAARKGFAGSVDIIPCRESVLAERARAVGSFAYTILREGQVIYERH